MGCLVMSLKIYQSSPRNIPEKRRLQIQGGRSLKSHMEVTDHIYILFNFSLHVVFYNMCWVVESHVLYEFHTNVKRQYCIF